MRQAGAATSAELQAACNASQASVSRALAPLLAAAEVIKVGRGRNQSYVMPRHLPGVGVSVPITKVDGAGEISAFATLVPSTNGRCWVAEDNGPAELHRGLAWFLAYMQPQGFIGRTFAQAHPELDLAANPDHWNDDDVLKALCVAGENLPGNLVVGAASLARLHALAPTSVHESDYPALADAALKGAVPGSSAGGEQPKFCAVNEGRAVIVKFSAAGNGPADQRWRDLLVCEHLALRTLADHGVPAVSSRIVMDAGRCFLEVERFDRTMQGRVGMVSLMAYDAQYVGRMDNWASAATRLAERALMRNDDADTLRFLEAFGRLIGNTDRHYGNISLLIDKGNWRLAPAYDMLPMIYAPVAGELVERAFDPAALASAVDTLAAWKDARSLARGYWQAVAGDKRISSGFRRLAQRHATALEQAR
jgi:hypothetical protein